MADTTHFGFQQVSAEEKRRRVNEVFNSVAHRYDLMNDLMSLGLHRIWKRHAALGSSCPSGGHVLDLAAGTADMTSLLYERVRAGGGAVTVCDINNAMLQRGRDRLLDEGRIRGVHFVQGDAENLPFADNSFDTVMMAFGLRNVANKERALLSIRSKLKYGGQLLILEFSRVWRPGFAALYDAWSFTVLPRLGKWLVNDAESYRYLAESIRRHPDQKALSGMLLAAGFGKVGCMDLSLGIAALHKACKL